MSETREYSGLWRFYKKPDLYQGTLSIDEETHVIRLSIIMPDREDKQPISPPYTGNIPYICGTLFDGRNLLLYQCTVRGDKRSHITGTNFFAFASYIFWGLEVKDEHALRFSGAFFEFGEIVEWSGLCCYKMENRGDDAFVIWMHRKPVILKIREELEVEVVPKNMWDISQNYETELYLKQSVWFNFRYKKRVPWETIMEDVLSIRYLIGLGITRKPGFRKARYSHPSQISRIEGVVLGSGLNIEQSDVIIGIDEELRHIKKQQKLDYLYRFEDVSTPERFARWCEVYPKLRPILDLYFGACMNETETDEMIFLNLVQALETLHARFVTNKVKEYFRRADQLTENYPKEEAEKWRTFLVDQGQERNKNGIYLRSRLADLTFAEGNILHISLGDEIDLEEFIQKVIFTRNYYTHYDVTKLERSFEMEDIPNVNLILRGLLQYHILKLLGFDTAKLRKRMIGTVLYVNMKRVVNDGIHENES